MNRPPSQSIKGSFLGILFFCNILGVAYGFPANLTIDIYGATLGEDWADFPVLLAPNLSGTPSSLEKLDVTLPIYLVWRNYMDYEVGEIEGGPIPITTLDFWDDHWDEVEFRLVHSEDFDDDYQACGGDIYAGLSLNSDGELTVLDEYFGGVGSNTRIELRWCFQSLAGPCGDEVVVVVQWDRPATYYDSAISANVDAYPGDVVVVEQSISSAADPGSSFDLFVPQKIVEWVSTDMRGTSAGYVDNGEVAAFAAFYPGSIAYGFTADGGRDSLTFHANFALWGSSFNAIDSADLTALATDMTTACGTSKTGDEGLANGILAWWGIGLTGEIVNVNGQLLPEYDVVDIAQFQVALNDPDGYLDRLLSSAAVENAPWGHTKSLFR